MERTLRGCAAVAGVGQTPSVRGGIPSATACRLGNPANCGTPDRAGRASCRIASVTQPAINRANVPVQAFQANAPLFQSMNADNSHVTNASPNPPASQT